MKRIFIINLLLLIVCGTSVFAQKVEFVNYKDPVHGMSISHPAGWTRIQDSSIAFGFMSPKGPKDAHADALFSLAIDPTEMDNAKAVMADYEKVCNREFMDYKKVKSGTQKLGGHDCAVLYFEATPRDQKLAIMVCIFVDYGSEYIFTCSSKPGTFKQNVAIFDKMIGSFKMPE